MFPLLLIFLTMRRTNGNERFRTESKLHLTAALRLRSNKVTNIKIVFMKNSDLDMSMFNRRSPKASLFCYPMRVVVHSCERKSLYK